jgi:hypothetical protein
MEWCWYHGDWTCLGRMLGLVFDDNSGSSSESLGLGILFVFLKVIMGSCFMQEGNISATWLLDMEGLNGAIMTIPLHFLIGPHAGYDPVESFRSIG